MINAVLSFALTMFIVIMILLFIFSKGLRELLNRKLKMRFMLIYISILVLATGIYFFMQPKFTAHNKVVERDPSMYELLEQWNNVEFPGKYEEKSWEVTLENQTVFLEVDEELFRIDAEISYDDEVYYENHVYIPVLVKQGAVDTAKVALYETPTTLAGIDISDYVEIPTVDVKENRVIVAPAEASVNEFYSIRNDMTLYQFSDRSMLDLHYHVNIGEIGLVITLPTGTKVEANPDYFDIIWK